jgi:hypothetical protein
MLTAKCNEPGAALCKMHDSTTLATGESRGIYGLRFLAAAI